MLRAVADRLRAGVDLTRRCSMPVWTRCRRWSSLRRSQSCLQRGCLPRSHLTTRRRGSLPPPSVAALKR